VRTGTTVVRATDTAPGNATTTVITGLTNGTSYNFRIQAVNAQGSSALSSSSNNVTPVGALVGALANVNFGRRPVNSTTTTTLTVTNTGTVALNVSSVTIGGSSTFTASLGTCSAPVAAAGSCTLNVTFHPTVAGTFAGTLTVNSNADNNPRTVTLSGRAP
jgi:hypothetical protein